MFKWSKKEIEGSGNRLSHEGIGKCDNDFLENRSLSRLNKMSVRKGRKLPAPK